MKRFPKSFSKNSDVIARVRHHLRNVYIVDDANNNGEKFFQLKRKI